MAKAEQATTKVGDRFDSPLHDEWVASVLGVALGIAFTLCFATGLVDYLAQHPPGWFHLPVHPINLYRVNEGVHVITGIATIPLLLAKLWSVWPKLFSWPPVAGVAHALERLSLIPLVGGSLFLLFTGVANIDYWYSPMPFFFPTAHFWAAWLVVGALVIHIGAKASTATASIARGPGPTPRSRRTAPRGAWHPAVSGDGQGAAPSDGPDEQIGIDPSGIPRRHLRNGRGAGALGGRRDGGAAHAPGGAGPPQPRHRPPALAREPVGEAGGRHHLGRRPHIPPRREGQLP